MTKLYRIFIAAVVLGMLAVSVSGCRKEGPMEKAGKDIDKAVEKTGDKMEKAGDKIKDSIK